MAEIGRAEFAGSMATAVCCLVVFAVLLAATAKLWLVANRIDRAGGDAGGHGFVALWLTLVCVGLFVGFAAELRHAVRASAAPAVVGAEVQKAKTAKESK